MIKYAEIEGYRNLGEIQLFSHVYQFIENVEENPKIILIHAYECDTKVFKGFLYNKSGTFKSVELLENEIKKLENYCGKVTQVDFDKIIKETEFADLYKNFKKQEEVKINEV